MDKIEYYCPAWDHVYNKEKLKEVVKNSKTMLCRLKESVIQVEREFAEQTEDEKNKEVLRRAEILQFCGNPLVKKSIEACRKNEKKVTKF